MEKQLQTSTVTTKIGIAGMGVVGKAVYHAFSPVYTDIKTYDLLDVGSRIEDLFECDFIFLCLPASEVEDLAYCIATCTMREDIVFILKSTVPPGTTDKLQHSCGNEWVFNPEFLTDRTANQDFLQSTRFILGGTGGTAVDRVEELFRERFRYTPIIKTTAKSAEFVKYMTNLFFTTKVSYMNEMRNASDELGLPWDSVVKMFMADGRIGNSHIDVPGPDGLRGYGGKCFPENINSYLEFTDKEGIDNYLIAAVKEVNDIYRNE
jgi:nucleotide sugar dehydrogenase